VKRLGVAAAFVAIGAHAAQSAAIAPITAAALNMLGTPNTWTIIQLYFVAYRRATPKVARGHRPGVSPCCSSLCPAQVPQPAKPRALRLSPPKDPGLKQE